MTDTCNGTTRSGDPCSRKAGEDGYCYQHGGDDAGGATYSEDEDLTEKQRRFVEAYMGRAEGNATEAAEISGYGGDRKTLAVRGHRLVRNPKILKAINARVTIDPLVADRKEIQRFWTRVIRGDEDDIEVVDGAPVRVPPALKERTKAAKLLAKTRGELVNKQDHTNSDGSLGLDSVDLSSLTDDELSQYKQLVTKAVHGDDSDQQ